jgi:hypothetical protein
MLREIEASRKKGFETKVGFAEDEANYFTGANVPEQ